jgi:Domain of unknown function (DUF4347)
MNKPANPQQNDQHLLYDPTVEDVHVLLDGLADGVIAKPLIPGADVMATLRGTLSSPDLRCLHILGHGAPGEVFLGGERIDADRWRHEAATPTPRINPIQINFWSCRTGEGEPGMSFINTVAQTSQAFVNAASGYVGHESKGGSWELDVSAKAVAPFSSTAMAGFNQVLAATTELAAFNSAPTWENLSALLTALDPNVTPAGFSGLTDAGRQTALLNDLISNKGSSAYTEASFASTFTPLAAHRVAIETAMNSINGGTSGVADGTFNKDVLDAWATTLKDAKDLIINGSVVTQSGIDQAEALVDALDGLGSANISLLKASLDTAAGADHVFGSMTEVLTALLPAAQSLAQADVLAAASTSGFSNTSLDVLVNTTTALLGTSSASVAELKAIVADLNGISDSGRFDALKADLQANAGPDGIYTTKAELLGALKPLAAHRNAIEDAMDSINGVTNDVATSVAAGTFNKDVLDAWASTLRSAKGLIVNGSVVTDAGIAQADAFVAALDTIGTGNGSADRIAALKADLNIAAGDDHVFSSMTDVLTSLVPLTNAYGSLQAVISAANTGTLNDSLLSTLASSIAAVGHPLSANVSISGVVNKAQLEAIQSATSLVTAPNADVVIPTVTGVAIAGANGTGADSNLAAGEKVVVSVTTSEAVNVAGGEPTYDIVVGTTTKTATYVSGDGTSGSPLKFEYTIVGGDTDTAGGVTAGANALHLGAGVSIKDAAGNPLTLATSAVAADANTVAVDGNAPTVTGVAIAGANGTGADSNLAVGEKVVVSVTTSEAVNVAGGEPTYDIVVGTTTKTATYVSGDGTSGSPLKFEYTIAAGDADTAGGVTAPADALSLAMHQP